MQQVKPLDEKLVDTEMTGLSSVQAEAGDLTIVAPNQKRQVSAQILFAGHKELAIMHGTDEYMLRITKQGKLILTK
ncbi:MAG TPA: hemin uptake protein HemP [Methyloradius sp.]